MAAPKKRGRPSKKKSVPENTETMATMQRKYPDYVFAICEVCGDWCVIWDDDKYFGMHPMGCANSATGEKIRRAKQKALLASQVAEIPTLL